MEHLNRIITLVTILVFIVVIAAGCGSISEKHSLEGTWKCASLDMGTGDILDQLGSAYADTILFYALEDGTCLLDMAGQQLKMEWEWMDENNDYKLSISLSDYAESNGMSEEEMKEQLKGSDGTDVDSEQSYRAEMKNGSLIMDMAKFYEDRTKEESSETSSARMEFTFTRTGDAPTSLDEIKDDPGKAQDLTESDTISKTKAVEIATDKAESNPLNKEGTVEGEYAKIYDQNSDAYIVFVPVGFDDGSGYNEVIWVNANNGDARIIDTVQDEWSGMYDVSTGKILYEENRNTDENLLHRPFYGIWCGASRSQDEAHSKAQKLIDKGKDARVFVTTDWSNLNKEKWYVISCGVYYSLLDAVKALPYIRLVNRNAYIKYSGDWVGESNENEILTEMKDEYYGVFITSFQDEDQCESTLMELEEAGFRDCSVVYTSDFSELNSKPCYVVMEGLYSSKDDADNMLQEVKAAGFQDAYVKNAGKYVGDTFTYTLESEEMIEVLDDRILLHDVKVGIPYLVDAESIEMDLYVDEKTEFDKSAEFEFFERYKKGDTPYTWIRRNYDFMQDNPDEYNLSGRALAGVFEVGLKGDHIEKYYGCYWWD